MINKMKAFYTFLILSILSCGNKGLNYNQGQSHNDQLRNRKRIVHQQDAAMKAGMHKARQKASRGHTFHKHKRHSKNKFIQ